MILMPSGEQAAHYIAAAAAALCADGIGCCSCNAVDFMVLRAVTQLDSDVTLRMTLLHLLA